MSEEYKIFLSFLNKNVNNDIELDCIIYNIGTAQRIVEQFSAFYNQQIKQGIKNDIEFEIDFENQCNEKIHLALGIGDLATLFVECELQDNNIFNVNINKMKIAKLTLEGIRNG